VKLSNLSKMDTLREALRDGGIVAVPPEDRGMFKMGPCRELEQEGLFRPCPLPDSLREYYAADTPTFEVTQAGRDAVAESDAKVLTAFLSRVAKFMETAGMKPVELTLMPDEQRARLNEEGSPWGIPYGVLLGGPSATVAIARTGSRYVVFQREREGEWDKDGVLVYNNGRWSSHCPSARTVSLGPAVVLAAKTLAKHRLWEKRQARRGEQGAQP
jgi:hypothetical protein